MSSPASNASSTDIRVITRRYGPIFAGQPEHTSRDPYGILPYNRRIRVTKDAVLQWNNRKRALEEFYWPVLDGQRVPPSEFSDLRKTHVFSNPSCLCAMESADGSLYTESAVFRTRTPGLAGEYVAACARKKCKYFILLERFYTRFGLPIRSYPLRAMGAPPPPAIEFDIQDFERHHPGIDAEEAPQTPTPGRTQAPGNLAATRIRRRRRPDTEVPEEGESSAQGLRRQRRRLQIEAPTVPLDPNTLPSAAPLPDAGPSIFRKLMMLDDMGLSLNDFEGLIHTWPEVIDLTADA
ncbi:hypothetical protein M413DRAFT_31775 [Hebeloma cylindrosporum]|uniref:Uncharacterized protein n=1 Tax=Hebeloma cylindrosporum TaxID=76867 RepID=A0A0C2XEK8_HEBCY|nr:hypothetical protein M413DRAFT_31775 [Hebeloma cylindrosporum h7]